MLDQIGWCLTPLEDILREVELECILEVCIQALLKDPQGHGLAYHSIPLLL
jgi:hypothetical protein